MGSKAVSQERTRTAGNVSYDNIRVLHIVISGLLIFTGCLFSSSIFSTYLTMAVFVQFYVITLLNDVDLVWKYVFLHYYVVTASVSVFLCETTRIYLYEIASATSFCGSFPLLALYYWMLISLLIVLDRKVAHIIGRDQGDSRISELRNVGKLVIRYACPGLFLLGVLMFLMVASKPAFALGVDRFMYAIYFLPPILNKLQLLPNMIAPLVVISLSQRSDYSARKKFVIYFVTFLPYSIFEIWIGQRFQAFFMLIWSMSPLVLSTLKKQRHKKVMMQQMRIVVVILAILFSVVLLFSQQREISVWDLLLERLGQQGQLWWKLYEQEKGAGFPLRIGEFPEELGTVLHSVIDRGRSKDYGIFRLMYLTVPENIVTGKLMTGSRYAAQGFELFFYYFKYFGIVAAPVLAAVLFSVLSNRYYHSISRGRMVRSVIYLRILQKALSAYCQGDWHALFSPVSLLCYAVLCLIAFERIRRKSIMPEIAGKREAYAVRAVFPEGTIVRGNAENE